MPEVNESQAAGRGTWFTPGQGASDWLWLSVVVIVLDQVTKALVVSSIDLYQSIELLPVLSLTHLHNTGAAFSMLAGASGWQRWFFSILALTVSVVLFLWLRKVDGKTQPFLAVGLSLVLGGALGNVIDRVWLGYVVDFIHVHWDRINFSFAAFNVADSAISIGAACLLFDAFTEGRRQKNADAKTEKGES